MYIDKDDFTAWMERIMDRFDMQDKKIDRVINGRNCLDGEELLDNQDLCLLLKVAPRTLTRYRKGYSRRRSRRRRPKAADCRSSRC